MITYVLIVQLMTTGQIVGLPEPSQAKCLADLHGFQSGLHNVVRLPDGIELPVGRALGCMTVEEYEARRAGKV